ncbi:MAG TPA: heme-binding protein [Polyangiaceae bacterium]|nr:heme-binding protein [Polyangiaceae bacterium]
MQARFPFVVTSVVVFMLLTAGLALAIDPGLVRAAFASSEEGDGLRYVSNRPTLTLDGAKRAAGAALVYARSHGAPGGAVAVVDAGGHTLYLERLDRTFPAAAEVSIGKARTAVNFGKPTRGLEEAINNGRAALLPVADVTWFTPLQGGVPIVVQNEVIGGIGVSGAANQQQDEQIAAIGAQAIAGASGVGARP